MLFALEMKQKAALLDMIVANFTAFKGDTGDIGPEPSDDRLKSLILPLIPDPIQGEKGDSIKGDPGKRGKDGENGTAPIKGVDYFTEDEITQIAEMAAGFTNPIIEKLEVTEDLARKLVQAMRSLPEKDRLEVQDIRNWQSMKGKDTFKKDGVTYKVEELMHGAGTGGGTSTNIVTEYNLQTKTQVGSDVVVPLSQLTNFATLTNVVAVYRNQIPQTNGITATITATDVTFLGADVEEIFSITYVYS